ncbi:hypothetical protein VNO77_04830 [Canavalia gladiata]|uniref:Uncharacterized protein n=1 Tax=Canavalia gladiata TaxID=3824 RepID=A0AAN9N2W7_CANGL
MSEQCMDDRREHHEMPINAWETARLNGDYKKSKLAEATSSLTITEDPCDPCSWLPIFDKSYFVFLDCIEIDVGFHQWIDLVWLAYTCIASQHTDLVLIRVKTTSVASSTIRNHHATKSCVIRQPSHKKSTIRILNLRGCGSAVSSLLLKPKEAELASNASFSRESFNIFSYYGDRVVPLSLRDLRRKPERENSRSSHFKSEKKNPSQFSLFPIYI